MRTAWVVQDIKSREYLIDDNDEWSKSLDDAFLYFDSEEVPVENGERKVKVKVTVEKA